MLPLTVGDLRKLIKDLDADSVVTYERIEDEYFTNTKEWVLEEVQDSYFPEAPDLYIEASTAFISDNKLRITAHF